MSLVGQQIPSRAELDVMWNQGTAVHRSTLPSATWSRSRTEDVLKTVVIRQLLIVEKTAEIPTLHDPTLADPEEHVQPAHVAQVVIWLSALMSR